MGPLTRKLIGEMEDLADLVERAGESGWCTSIRKSISYLSSSNYQGIEDAKKWFGTFGTLNDLIIHPINGHKIKGHELDEVNSRLRALSSNIYGLLQEIERNTSYE